MINLPVRVAQEVVHTQYLYHRICGVQLPLNQQAIVAAHPANHRLCFGGLHLCIFKMSFIGQSEWGYQVSSSARFVSEPILEVKQSILRFFLVLESLFGGRAILNPFFDFLFEKNFRGQAFISAVFIEELTQLAQSTGVHAQWGIDGGLQSILDSDCSECWQFESQRRRRTAPTGMLKKSHPSQMADCNLCTPKASLAPRSCMNTDFDGTDKLNFSNVRRGKLTRQGFALKNFSL